MVLWGALAAYVLYYGGCAPVLTYKGFLCGMLAHAHDAII